MARRRWRSCRQPADTRRQPAGVDVARRPDRGAAAGLRCARRAAIIRRWPHGRPGRALLWAAVPPRSAPHPGRQGNPAPLRRWRSAGAAGLDARIRSSPRAVERVRQQVGRRRCCRRSAAGSIPASPPPWCSAPSASSWWPCSSTPACCARERRHGCRQLCATAWASS